MTADDLRVIVTGITLVLACQRVGALIGDLHAAYHIRQQDEVAE